jgi:hypothetical protein
MYYFRFVKLFVLSTVVSTGLALAQGDAIVATGTFHGALHKCEGRATVYKTANGEVLRLTHFKTSNGPDLHVILIAASDGDDNENFLDKKIERIELGPLKGNEGDQNYSIPAETDLNKFKAVSIYCVRFNANFGTAPLDK